MNGFVKFLDDSLILQSAEHSAKLNKIPKYPFDIYVTAEFFISFFRVGTVRKYV